MGREFTVYGLRFSKTSFWNHVNTGFLDPAVATALTACGIETISLLKRVVMFIYMLQQRLPLAVLKQAYALALTIFDCHVATALTACGIETLLRQAGDTKHYVLLQQRLPLAVLKPSYLLYCEMSSDMLQQRLPLAVLKLIAISRAEALLQVVATALTACGIETSYVGQGCNAVARCNSAYRLRY